MTLAGPRPIAREPQKVKGGRTFPTLLRRWRTPKCSELRISDALLENIGRFLLTLTETLNLACLFDTVKSRSRTRPSYCPLNGHFGPKIDKKTHLRNQNPVVGPVSGFLVGRNRTFLLECSRWSMKRSWRQTIEPGPRGAKKERSIPRMLTSDHEDQADNRADSPRCLRKPFFGSRYLVNSVDGSYDRDLLRNNGTCWNDIKLSIRTLVRG